MTCPGGYYCNDATNYQRVDCPINHYCPAGTAFPIPCGAGIVCAGLNNIVGTKCIDGFEKIDDPLDNNNPAQEVCWACEKGTYSDDAAVGCLPCPAGYLCYGPILVNETDWLQTYSDFKANPGTNTPTPLLVPINRGEPCPVGNYCPEGSFEPTPCPVGTYNPDLFGKSVEDCVLCEANTYNDEEGQQGC